MPEYTAMISDHLVDTEGLLSFYVTNT